METPDHELQPLLEARPYFEDKAHCEAWVDQTLLLIDSIKGTSDLDVDPQMLQGVIENLEYAKKMLTEDIIEPQQVINDRFHAYAGTIGQNLELWGEVGALYMKIAGYLSRKNAKENQE